MACSEKRSFSELQNTKMRCPKDILDDEEGPVKKKLKKNLIDIFNRASMCVNASEDHMKVFLRIKPFTSEDSCEENQDCLKVNESDQSVIASAPELSNTHKNLKRGLGKSEHKFTFSRIFNEDTSQAAFFNETTLDMTKEFISGQNSLVFTYGVTSSGKTYTIQGQPQDAGILPRSLDVLFNSINGKQIEGIKFKPLRFTDVTELCPEEEAIEKKLKEKTLKLCLEDDFTVTTLLGDETMASCSSNSQDESLPEIESRIREELKVDVDDHGKFNFSVWVSFAEIYNEQIFDLLERIPHKKSSRTTLKISDDQNGSPYIKGLKEIHVDSADEAYRLLTIGQRNLQTASTRLNHCSSRSHCIFTIKIIRVVDKDDPNFARVSMLSFCDLAGSERYSKTQATGERLKEAGNINTSLLTLGRCIEILRYNQMHREGQKMVPFRESKLTRLFTNFFNGSGRAAMIVNVSQCASMFDETLHVFKFSAIAKQVKYLQKPVDTPKPKKKKILPPLPRPSIAWEKTGPSKGLLDAASNEPLPTDTDDSEEESNMEEDSTDMDYIISKKSPAELRQTIRFLMDKNAKLIESLEEEMINSSNLEIRVRREVCETMMKQQVLIEKEYSKLLEESEEEAKETMDERIQNVIEIYEKKLERIQQKVDDDDEWVSSLLFYQERTKVKERDAKIVELEKLLAEKDTNKVDISHKEKDEKIEHLEEYIAELRSLHHSTEKEKEEKIQELESYIQEAGDVYKENMARIDKLRQEAVGFALETKTKEERLVKLQAESANFEALYNKSLEQIEELQKHSESKTKEADDKISELQANLMDVEMKMTSKDNTIKTLEEECQQMQGELECLQDQISELDEVSKRSNLETCCDNGAQTDPMDIEDLEDLKERNRELQVMKDTMDSEKAALEKKWHALIDDNSVLQQRVCSLEEKESEMTNLKEMNEELNAEILVLQQEVKKHALNQTSAQSTIITDMVRELETNSTPRSEIKKSQDSVVDSDDEVVFKQSSLPAPGDYCESNSVNVSSGQLKEAEVTINALRNKLKREEEDFFKREQALIHGYTAEVDNLKLELVKLRKKSETSKVKSQTDDQSEMKKNLSLLSNGVADEGEKSVTDQSENSLEDKCSVGLLMSELSSCQEQLLSLNKAYRQLQSQGRNNETQSFVQEVVSGNPGKRLSTPGVFCLEDNMTDSVIQFEMTEYAVKLDVWKKKVEEQNQELEGKNKLLIEADSQNNDLQERLNEMLREKTVLEDELKEGKSNNTSFEIKVTKLKERIEDHQRVISEKECAFEEVNTNLQASLHSNTEMKKAMDDLNNRVERMEEDISVKENILKDRNSELNDALKTNSDLKDKAKAFEELMESFKQEAEEAQLKLKKYEEKAKDSSLLNDIQKELQAVLSVNSQLNSEKEKLEREAKELRDKLNVLSSEIEGHEKDTANRDQELQEAMSQLDKEKEANTETRNTLEKMKQIHQQESAEVSQKLILLEKEKRIAERKLNEMKGKEEEWQMKFQGQEKMKELEHQLQNQLRTTTEALRKHSSKTNELSDELDKQQTEISQLKEERDLLKRELENLQTHASKTEEEYSFQRQKSEEAQKRAEELMTNVNDLKRGLQDSDETTEHQEKIITAQDEQIDGLKSNLNDLSNEKDQLLKAMLEKEQEIKALSLKVKEKELNEDKATTMEEKFQKVDSEKGDLEARLKRIKTENENLEEELEKRVNKSKKDKKELEDLQEEMEKMKNESQRWREKFRTVENDLEEVNLKMQDEVEKRNQVEKEIDDLKKKRDTDLSNTSLQHEEMKRENLKLKGDMSKYTDQLKDKTQIVDDQKLQFDKLKQNMKQQEKDLAKQESINRRNKEEMEVWKKEKDHCVANFEDVLKRVVQEKKDLTHENERLKKDNADLAKQVTNSRNAKDKVIADLRKNNNTLSIELASIQGMSPPPKIETPESGFHKRIEFVEDVDTTGHLEVDATPPVALKKGKKRQGSAKNISSSLGEVECYTPTRKSLKTIEETNEQSPCTSGESMKNTPSESMKNPPSGVVSDLAKEIFSSLSSPRSGKSHNRTKQKKALPPSALTSFNVQDENELPLAARRSSRLRSKSTSKHSVI